MKHKLYVAYGSNLNLEQMRQRCPGAEIHCIGQLNGWRLAFRGHPGNAHLTIEPDEKSTVPVLLWDITEADETRLDRYEGYPSYYYKTTVKVDTENWVLDAMVYIMTDGNAYNSPSQFYAMTCSRGYKDCGFDIKVLQKAYNYSMKKVGTI